MPMVSSTFVRPFHTSSIPSSTQPVRCSMKASVVVTLAGFAAYALALLSCGAYHILPDEAIADIQVSLRTPHIKLLFRNVPGNAVSSNHQSRLPTLADGSSSITPSTSVSTGSSTHLDSLDPSPAMTRSQITSASRESDVRHVVGSRDDTNGAPHPLSKRLTELTRESLNRLLLSQSSLATCSPLHAETSAAINNKDHVLRACRTHQVLRI
jgi:hypothetical protein